MQRQWLFVMRRPGQWSSSVPFTSLQSRKDGEEPYAVVHKH